MLDADIHLIQLALSAVEEAKHHEFMMMFAAAGKKLDPLERMKPPKQRPSAAQIKGWAAAVNARHKARKRERASAEPGTKLKRPGGGRPPRPSRPPKKAR